MSKSVSGVSTVNVLSCSFYHFHIRRIGENRDHVLPELLVRLRKSRGIMTVAVVCLMPVMSVMGVVWFCHGISRGRPIE